jgi:hypothetical protein
MSFRLMVRAALRVSISTSGSVLILQFAQGSAQPMRTNFAFEPETVDALATAFHKSWSFISSEPRFAREDPELLQRCLAKYLMQLAAEGERNPLRLANGAIGRMRQEHGLEAAL